MKHVKTSCPNLSMATSLQRRIAWALLLAALGAACDSEVSAPEVLVIDRVSHDFGQVHVGDMSEEMMLTIRNGGAERVSELAVRLDADSGFVVTASTCAGLLEPSATCTMTVAFVPLQAGPAQTSIVVEGVVEGRGARGSAELFGVGAVTVRIIRSGGSRATVRSEPAGILCGSTCEATFTVPEIRLTTDEEGIAAWTGPCEEVAEVDDTCRFRLEGDTTVELSAFEEGLLWQADVRVLNRMMTMDAEDNIIYVDYTNFSGPRLVKLSPEGQLLWERRVDYWGPEVVVDSRGNITLLKYDGQRVSYDAAGEVLGRQTLPDTLFDNTYTMAVDDNGDVYIVGTLEMAADDVRVILAKYDSAGNFLWSREYAPKPESRSYNLAVDRNGCVLRAS